MSEIQPEMQHVQKRYVLPMRCETGQIMPERLANCALVMGTGAGSARLRAVERRCGRRIRADGSATTSRCGGDGAALPVGAVGSVGGDARYRAAVRATYNKLSACRATAGVAAAA